MTDSVRTRERSERMRRLRQARHRAPAERENFGRGFAALGDLAYEGAQVSAKIMDLDTGRVLMAVDDRIVLPTASIGKILLLVEVSARMAARDPSAFAVLDKTARDSVGDSGVWQHLQATSLSVPDLAALIAATSDNLATNVLLRHIGLEAVRARGEEMGLMRTALLDLVRDSRGPDDAPQLSVGSTAELAWLFGALANNQVVDSLTSARVLAWLSLNTDLSMVASAFGLDPLAHRGADHRTLLVNKTGTDTGVRAEAGVVRGRRAAAAYAVSVQFSDDDIGARLRVLEAMRTIGMDLLEYVH